MYSKEVDPDGMKKIFNTIVNDYKDEFKQPDVNLFIQDNQKKVKNLSYSTLNDTFKNTEYQLNNSNKKKILCLEDKLEKLDNEKKKELLFSYTEPVWSGKPQEIYKLEVLKSGIILKTINLSNQNYHVIGRLPSCDISLAHPTISRYHAVIQFRIIEDEKNKKGIYIYDLESTHGTFWNGKRIKSNIYIRLRGGHIISFGCSQRKFIVQVPVDDQEEESEYSFKELKEINRLKNKKVEEQKLFEKENDILMKVNEQIEGIDWGMSEDANEETDLTENPYAKTNNEELFLNEPKKTLRGWFERQGYDLQYQIEDKGIGKFLCFVNLPIDHVTQQTIKVEAIITGKKKEAVVQCALEACRVLDRYGLLRQASHEAKKKKNRNWEEQDYYDSDEDNFLDRTGIIERKREQRMRLAGKLEPKVETYNSLFEKHSEVIEKIKQIENTIAFQSELKQNESNESNIDTLDVYMSKLESSILNKTEIRKIKMELINLRREETQLLKLINLAKPTNLPLLESHVSSMVKNVKNDSKYLKSIIGKKKKLKCATEKSKMLSQLTEAKININPNKNKVIINNVQEISQQNIKLYKHEIKDKKQLGNSFKNNNVIKLLTNNMHKTEKKFNIEGHYKSMKLNQQISESTTNYQTTCIEDGFREDYNMWLPPKNQSGDGKTSLNEKFGY